MATSAANAFVLFPGPAGWQAGVVNDNGNVSIADLPSAANDTPDALAATAADALKTLGWRGQGVALALPSAWCLCARVATDGLPPKNRRQALTFRLEEKLPVSAEEVVADFVQVDGETPDVLGACAETAVVGRYVAALDGAGVAVESIAPAALLAAQDQSTAGESDGVLLWGDGADVELFAFAAGRPVAWRVLPADGRDVAMHVAMEARGRPAPIHVRAVSLSPDVLRPVAALPGVELNVAGQAGPVPIREAAARAAAAVLGGRLAPWVELRRGALSAGDGARRLRRPLAALVASVAILLAACAAAMLLRAARYESAAREREELQRQVFQRTFPGRPVPVDVRSRMLSERQALRALNGDADGGTGADAVAAGLPAAQSSGLFSLRDALSALPRDLRFRVLELRLDEGKLLVEGHAKSHGDADAIAAALRDGGAFEIDPPRTEQLTGLSRGVAFTITGTARADAPAAPAKAGRDRQKDKRDKAPSAPAPIARRESP